MSVGSLRHGGTPWHAETLGDLFYPLYDRLVDEDSEFVANLEETLAGARMASPVEMYVSWALGLGLLVGVACAVAGVGVGYLLYVVGVISSDPILGVQVGDPRLVAAINAAKVPALILTAGLLLGTLGFGAVFGSAVAVPYFRAADRKREINRLLPDAVSFMYALSQGGMSQLDIIEAVAEADDTYGEVAREFETIVKETEYFETDYRSAIRQQSIETPSEELGRFLTDLLSIIDSGGDVTRFLNDKKNQHFRTAKQEEEEVLDTLELFGEIFITISLFPLLLIIMLVVLQLLGRPIELALYATTYVLLPFLGFAFVIVVAIVKIDDPGDGHLEVASNSPVEDEGTRGLFDRGLVDEYVGEYHLFDRIRDRDGTVETLDIVSRPHVYFRDHPAYTAALTLPAAAVLVGMAVVTGAVPTTWSGVVDRPVASTVVYVYLPAFLVGVPLAAFHEWNMRTRRAVMNGFADELRKLASANDTGMTLLESIRTVADTSSGRLASELGVVYAKTRYGMSLEDALVVFNNRYRLPRLARTVKLIAEAQRASNQISAVLTTAAQAVENGDEIRRERRSRTRLQVGIVILTFLTLLAVMAILKTRFIDVIARLTQQTGGGGAAGFSAALNADLLSLLFFHAVTLQAVVAGLVSGYMRDSTVLAGVKYVVGLLTVSLAVWLVVG
ncbi:type II secretion system F family protein [Halorarius halobius]|uniref:type II secretion system F family protein n=1 Tax=Halorarius halobius TaxID=2962671 RepID=UPI0020CF607A|nr:type II secretion system F family protein [Halorarius halobius]